MRRILGLLLLLLLVETLQAQKFSGLVFGDYYYVASHHNENLKNQNGFWIRRVYFTVDQELRENVSMRLRLEMAHPGNFTAGNAVPFVKDAYLRWKFNPQHELLLGISGSVTFGLVESVWGYRSVEKTPADLQKVGSSREFGVALKGKLSEDGTIRYHALVGNGEGTKSEGYKGKKVQLALQFFPTDALIFEVYGDYAQKKANEKYYTGHIFAAYRTKVYRVGVEYEQQHVRNGIGRNFRYISGFAAVKTGKKLNLFERVDRLLDPNPKGESISYLPFASDSKATFILAGVDYGLNERVRLIPNMEIVLYDRGYDSDVMLRFTFFYAF